MSATMPMPVHVVVLVPLSLDTTAAFFAPSGSLGLWWSSVTEASVRRLICPAAPFCAFFLLLLLLRSSSGMSVAVAMRECTGRRGP